ncbi:MAG: SDR family oxidoreductase [Chitinophagales bacterium]|nr:SDR family oxidoreductase [Chitinophagales bacterium]
MNLNLEGKTALVGGGSRGIGLASAIELALLGARVTLIARSENDLQAALKLLDSSKGQKHDYLVADYSDLKAVERKIDALLEKQGGFQILVNNTGGPAGGPITNAQLNEFTSAFNNHLLLNHLLVQKLLPGMKSADYGRIINIISTSVKIPLNGLGVSNTIRGAVASWAKTMANELGAFGITVNNVLPGATATDRLEAIINTKASKSNTAVDKVAEQMKAQVPLNRFALPEEIGAFVAFLASPAAAYINGTSTPVDGGRTGSI